MARRLIIGGLGGGGDVGLASILVEGLGLAGSVVAVVSFNRCRASSIGTVARGALARVEPGAWLGKRFFEDKLYRVASWAREVYVSCTREPWESIVEGLEWAVERLEPDCIVSGDIGGDSLVLGYESRLGSYITDTIAKAALSLIREEYGVETVVAVAGIGAEGGGTALSLADLYATLVFLEEKNVFLGGWAPDPRHTTIAKKLLSMGESGMLPLYIAAVEGRDRAEIRQAYLDGVYEVKPWYRYVLFADAAKLCNVSPLCREAKQGKKALKKWAKTQPPRHYASLQRRALEAEARGRLEQQFKKLVERIAGKPYTPCNK